MKKYEFSESYILLFILALSGGLQDAYTYNCRGHVFANGQTGNLVLLGQSLVSQNFRNVLLYALPIFAFLAGCYLSEVIEYHFKQKDWIHWRQLILAIEIIVLFIAGLIPNTYDTFANILVSACCALQVNGFKRFRGLTITTTYCMGNMNKIVMNLFHYRRKHEAYRKNHSLLYLYIVLTFLGGALFGYQLSTWLGNRAIWVSCMLLAVCFVGMFQKKQESIDM